MYQFNKFTEELHALINNFNRSNPIIIEIQFNLYKFELRYLYGKTDIDEYDGSLVDTTVEKTIKRLSNIISLYKKNANYDEIEKFEKVLTNTIALIRLDISNGTYLAVEEEMDSSFLLRKLSDLENALIDLVFSTGNIEAAMKHWISDEQFIIYLLKYKNEFTKRFKNVSYSNLALISQKLQRGIPSTDDAIYENIPLISSQMKDIFLFNEKYFCEIPSTYTDAEQTLYDVFNGLIEIEKKSLEEFKKDIRKICDRVENKLTRVKKLISILNLIAQKYGDYCLKRIKKPTLSLKKLRFEINNIIVGNNYFSDEKKYNDEYSKIYEEINNMENLSDNELIDYLSNDFSDIYQKSKKLKTNFNFVDNLTYYLEMNDNIDEGLSSLLDLDNEISAELNEKEDNYINSILFMADSIDDDKKKSLLRNLLELGYDETEYTEIKKKKFINIDKQELINKTISKIMNNSMLVNSIISGEHLFEGVTKRNSNMLQGDFTFLVAAQIKAIERFIKQSLLDNIPGTSYKPSNKKNSYANIPFNRNLDSLSDGADEDTFKKLTLGNLCYVLNYNLKNNFNAFEPKIVRNKEKSVFYTQANIEANQCDLYEKFINDIRNGYFHTHIIKTLEDAKRIRKETGFFLLCVIDELKGLK